MCHFSDGTVSHNSIGSVHSVCLSASWSQKQCRLEFSSSRALSKRTVLKSELSNAVMISDSHFLKCFLLAVYSSVTRQECLPLYDCGNLADSTLQ